jgi:transcriptional regulator with XRE-family HTH domain
MIAVMWFQQLIGHMLSLKTEADLLRSVADSVRQHRLAQGLRQADLAEKTGVSIATLRRFERTGHIGFLGLARLLTTLGLADAFIAAFQRVPETPPSIKEFMTAHAGRRKRAPRRPR